jgi:hypothetical protein
MRVGMEVVVSMGFLSINLVGYGSIKVTSD